MVCAGQMLEPQDEGWYCQEHAGVAVAALCEAGVLRHAVALQQASMPIMDMVPDERQW